MPLLLKGDAFVELRRIQLRACLGSWADDVGGWGGVGCTIYCMRWGQDQGLGT